METKQDFEVVLSSTVDEDTDVVTVINYGEKVDAWESQQLYAAIQKYNADTQQSGAVLKDGQSAGELTLERLNTLATDIHSTIDNVLEVNAMIRKQLVLNELVGKTFESIYGNVNTGHRLYWPEISGRNKQKTLVQAKEVIEDFLRQIKIGSFIRDSVSMIYLEGNRYFYLRQDDGNWFIDKLPLGICYASDYVVNGEPSLAINVKKLEAGLKKTYQTTKQRKAVWFKNVRDDIKNNYPYIWKEYEAGESIVRLDTKYAKACRYNNVDRKFGVSPVMKVLPDIIVLDNIRKADVTTSKTKQRVIIVQILRKELLGTDGKRKGLAEAAHSHQQLMSALSTTASTYTAAPYVESLAYVQPTADDTSDNKMEQYTKSLMLGLGIAFVDTDTATSAAGKLNLDELCKTVDAIADGVQDVLNGYFVTVLEANGIDPMYAPHIDILDSKALDMAMRKDLATFCYSILGLSARTSCELVGIDYDTELARRTAEKENGDEDILTPHGTAYTKSAGGGEAGRPPDEDPDNPDKQARDKDTEDNKS